MIGTYFLKKESKLHLSEWGWKCIGAIISEDEQLK